MALTKQDINQIGGLLDKQSKAFEKRFDTIEKRMVTKDDLDKKLAPINKRLDQNVTKNDLRKGLAALNQSIERGFADQAELMKNTYASKEEVEELRNELDELREKVEALERQQHLAA